MGETSYRRQDHLEWVSLPDTKVLRRLSGGEREDSDLTGTGVTSPSFLWLRARL